MKILSLFFYRIANPKTVSIAMMGLILYAWLIMGEKSACFQSQFKNGERMLDLHFGYSLEDASKVLKALDTTGLNCYREMATVWDNIFPLIYTLSNILILSLIWRNIVNYKSYSSLLNLSPLISMILDFAENRISAILIDTYVSERIVSESLVAYGSFVGILKWSSSIITISLVVIGIVVFVKRKRSAGT